MDGDSTSLQQGSLIGPGFGSGRRVRGVGPLQQAAPDPLRSLGRHHIRAIDRRADQLAVQTLESLADCQDRDGRPISGRCFRHRTDERGADERPGGIVNEDYGVA